MYLHTKSTYFRIAVSSRIRFYLPVAAYQPCSTLGASQHSSILHCEIPLRFRERGRARSTIGIYAKITFPPSRRK